jgi:hypothetical protein
MSEEIAENQNDAVESEEALGEELYDHETSKEPGEGPEDGAESERKASEEDKQEEGPEDGEEDSTENEEKATSEVEYDLRLPEDSGLDVGLIDKIESYAKARGLSNDDAQELLDTQSEAILDYRDSLIEDGKKSIAEEKAAFENDPDFGRDNLAASEELQKQAVKRFISDEDFEALRVSGIADTDGFKRVITR